MFSFPSISQPKQTTLFLVLFFLRAQIPSQRIPSYVDSKPGHISMQCCLFLESSWQNKKFYFGSVLSLFFSFQATENLFIGTRKQIRFFGVPVPVISLPKEKTVWPQPPIALELQKPSSPGIEPSSFLLRCRVPVSVISSWKQSALISAQLFYIYQFPNCRNGTH